jgi:hypothetical protein
MIRIGLLGYVCGGGYEMNWDTLCDVGQFGKLKPTGK